MSGAAYHYQAAEAALAKAVSVDQRRPDRAEVETYHLRVADLHARLSSVALQARAARVAGELDDADLSGFTEAGVL